METFLIYLVKCSSFLGLFYLSYILFLKKETFFKSNRYFLTGGITASILLPFVVLKKVIWISPTPISTQAMIPVEIAQDDIINSPIDWWSIAGVIYIMGFLFFLGKLTIQIISLLVLFRKNNIEKREGINFVKISDTISPFSFFNYIVYNPKAHTQEELDVIIKHEKTHSNQLHSIDILYGHLIAAFLWPNPFSWLYKKIIAQNLEYIADNATTLETASTKEYQYMLLKVATRTHQYSSITSNFFNSLIKKRIVMLNQQQSQKHKAWKYIFILPLLAAFIMSFNTETTYKTRGHSANENSNISLNSDQLLEFIVTKNTSDQELDAMVKKASTNGVTLNFTDLKRDRGNLITRVTVAMQNGGEHIGHYGAGNSKESINSFIIYKELTENEFTYIGRIDGATMFTNPKEKVNAKEFQILREKIHRKIVSLGIQSQDKLPIPLYDKENTTKEPVIVLDGKIISEKKLNTYSDEEFASYRTLQPQEAIKIYGDIAKHGALIIVSKIKQKVKFKITKNTSDKELNNIVKSAKKQGVVIQFSKVKRSSKGEIISIKAVLNTKNGNSNYNVKSNEPILPFTIFFNDSSGNFGFSNNSGKDKEIEEIIVEEVEVTEVTEDIDVEIEEKETEAEIVKETEVIIEHLNNEKSKKKSKEEKEIKETIKKTRAKKIKKANKTKEPINISESSQNKPTIRLKKSLILVDGKEISEEEFLKIDQNSIESIRVFKDKVALNKYGKKGKNGVVIITLKK